MVIGVVLIGQRLKVPYPIALVIGGLGIGLVPGLPEFRIDPDLVFLFFLPPLLYAAAWLTSWHEFRSNLRPIFMLAVGLVLFTTLVTGLVMHYFLPALPLAIAFCFGAIVSPPDAVAATAIAEQMKLPKRIVTILEGESLVNDATGLVALRFALAAAASGHFSAGHALAEFVWVAVGGIALGLLVAIGLGAVMKVIGDDFLLITLSLVAPYLAYLPAERLHVSGVLAAVAAGAYGGWKGPELLRANTRLSAMAVWGMLVFLFNCVLFILIGLQLPEVVAGLGHYSTAHLALLGAVASGVVILVRFLWVFPAVWLQRFLFRGTRTTDPLPRWQHAFIVAWSGMRGVVSLAAALALPVTLTPGQAFPGRDLIIFLTFCVVLSTLVFQGLSLPWVIKLLKVKDHSDDTAERQARLKLAQAGLAQVQACRHEIKHDPSTIDRVSALYEERVRHLNDQLAEMLGWSPERERLVATRRLSMEALHAERAELMKLRREHQIPEDLMRNLQREMDLAEIHLKG